MADSSQNKKMFKVLTSLSIRTEPGVSAPRLSTGLTAGMLIEVEASSRQDKDGYIWWKHNQGGWSAERKSDGSTVYMEPEAVKEIPASTAKAAKFKVLTWLSVRSTPGVNAERLETQLQSGQIIDVTPDSRSDVDGYVWWKHNQGWSAERKSDGSAVYMEEVKETTAAQTGTSTGSTSTGTTDATKTQQTGTKRTFKVMQTLSVRSAPGLSAQRLERTFSPGETLEVESDSRKEVDSYFWWKHSLGWSAERKSDGSIVFLGEASAQATVNTNGTINVAALPQRDTLFKRLPVDQDKVNWIQYYGNTIFAFENGKKWGYNTFAQGLHSGLDLGSNTPAGIPVYAGIEGTFLRNNSFGVAIQSGEYVVVFQHLQNTTSYKTGGAVNPNTILGGMDGNNHVHVEIRYDRERWIVNPLIFLPPDSRNWIMNRWSDYSKHFYKSSRWALWQTPLDQPVIQLGGPVVGPTA